MSLKNSDFQAQQAAWFARDTQKRMSGARVERERMVYKFQKEFILAAVSREGIAMDFDAVKTSMEAATLHLFPVVTEVNADEYFIRAY